MAEKVGDAYVEIGTRDKGLTKGLNRAKSKVGGFSAGSIVALGSVIALTAGVRKLLKLTFGQEDAEKNLESALIANGDAYDDLLPKLKKQAAAIQKLSKFGDEQNLQTMVTLRNLGVQADALGTATKQAIGLSEALKLDASSAARYTALARQGEFTILQRYVPALRAATTEAEKQTIVTDLMNRGWEQAQRNATTTSGAITQLSNAFGDLGETFGDMISGDGLGGALIDLKLLVEDLDKALKDLDETGSLGGLSEGAEKASNTLRRAAGFWGAVVAGESFDDAINTANAQLEIDNADRAARRKLEIDKITGDLVDDIGLKGGGAKKAKGAGSGFNFTSPESAIKAIQAAVGKDNEQKKQTAILGNIDLGIKELNTRDTPAVVGV